MALSKIDPSKIFKTVSTMDPAIDKEATGEENWKNFQESYDMSFLKFKQGEFPTIFNIVNILSSEEAKIKQDHMKIEYPELENGGDIQSIDLKNIRPTIKQVNGQEMMIKYFNFGVKEYEENGQKFPCSADVFPYGIVQEIGALIMMRTQLGDDLKNVLGS